MKEKKTLVVNLYGGPGTGKSTMAALLFARLKGLGVNCEIVMEYAKDLTWQESFNVLGNQVYVFGKQQHRLWRLKGKVDVIITDAPLLHSMVYNKDNLALDELVMTEYKKHRNFDIFLRRVKPYNPAGRTQNLGEAIDIDFATREILTTVRGPFDWCDLMVDGEDASVKEIIDAITEEL